MTRLLGLICASLLPGCDRAVCRCVSLSGVSVEITAGRAGDVKGVTASGPACDGERPLCVSGSSRCTEWRVLASGPGVCLISVTFSSGAAPYETAVTFEKADASGCCGGGYDPVGPSRFQVPEAPLDGGAAG